MPCRLLVTGTDGSWGTPSILGTSMTAAPLNLYMIKVKGYASEMVIMDAGCRMPAIAHELLTDGIQSLMPYKRLMTRGGFLRNMSMYMMSATTVISARRSTSWHTGQQTGRGMGSIRVCTHSKSHVKTVIRHVWEGHMETVEDIRHTRGNRDIYARRKETIEKIFGTAKGQHGLRYTQYIGKARMEMKAGLTFACMNLKKLARILAKKGKGGLPTKERSPIF